MRRTRTAPALGLVFLLSLITTGVGAQEADVHDSVSADSTQSSSKAMKLSGGTFDHTLTMPLGDVDVSPNLVTSMEVQVTNKERRQDDRDGNPERQQRRPDVRVPACGDEGRYRRLR